MDIRTSGNLAWAQLYMVSFPTWRSKNSSGLALDLGKGKISVGNEVFFSGGDKS